MKRFERIRHLEAHGCGLLREGAAEQGISMNRLVSAKLSRPGRAELTRADRHAALVSGIRDRSGFRLT